MERYIYYIIVTIQSQAFLFITKIPGSRAELKHNLKHRLPTETAWVGIKF